MSDGIDYRLGYLNGRLRAYESEEDLVKLVSKTTKTQKKPAKAPIEDETKVYTIKGKDGKDIIL